MADSAIIRKFILAFLTVAILWGGVAGYRALTRGGKKRFTIKAELPAADVKIMTVKRGNVSTHLTGYGTVRGKREVLIIPEVGGKIVFINSNFESGKRVKKAETLFTIDTRSIKIQIDQIKGEISRLKARIQIINQEAVNIKRNLETVIDNVKLAEKEVKKNEALIRKRMVSEQVLDTSRRNYLRERNSRIDYENQLAMIPLKVKELEAALVVRNAELNSAFLKLEKSEIRTPFDGIIYDKSVEMSQVVQAGQTVGILVDASILEIPVDLNVKNIGYLSFRRFKRAALWKYPCTVFWDVQENSVMWKGYISRIEKINEATRTVRVIVEVADGRSSDLDLTKGMFCRVILPGKRYEDVVSIPSLALRGNDTVYISEKKRLQIKKVSVLQRTDDSVVIGSGLSPGDKVIVSALSNPVIGMQLR